MMTEQSYTVALTEPIQIYPAGLQPAVTVVNTGTVTVTVSSLNQSTGGYPILAGNSVVWPANTPLYARVSGAVAGQLLIFSGDIQAPTNVTATVDGAVSVTGGNIVTGNAATLLYAEPPPAPGLTFTLSGLSKYASLLILVNVAGSYGIVGNELRLGWSSDGVAPVTYRRCGYPRATASEWTVPVLGDHVAIGLIGDAASMLTVIGFTARQESRFLALGNPPTVPDDNAASLTTAAFIPGTSVSWVPPARSGRAILTVRTTSPTNTGNGLFVTLNGNTNVFTWGDLIYSALTYFTKSYDLILPEGPFTLVFLNGTAVNQTLELGLVYNS